MTILVTGATGNIGRRVVAGLLAAGRPVRAMTRDPEAAAALLPAGARIVRGDFEDPDTWEAALDGVDRVHLFPFVDPAPAQGPGFIGAAVDAGVRRFAVHSAAAAGFPYQGDPGDASLTPYRRHLADEREAHLAVERAVEASGAEWTHVRPGLLAAGTLDRAAEIRAGEVRSPYPGARSTLVHEADVAEVAVAALVTDDHLGCAHTVTGPEPLTEAEQVAAVARAVGREVRFTEITPEQARREWYDPERGVTREVLDRTLEMMAAAETADQVPPTDTYRRITGRPPRTYARWARDHREDFA
ncbi:NAD(P)H-binding protein [Nocardiopsis potens]|uniref:NAD(P)H-binding protein n=1 Tax=Nocardiopsis potens TaxID=1246458 RepID=UPI000593AFC1|nr:NAD(P)H-binding protein [Nocardiopsis potens]